MNRRDFLRAIGPTAAVAIIPSNWTKAVANPQLTLSSSLRLPTHMKTTVYYRINQKASQQDTLSAIAAKYAELGSSNGILGRPETDEQATRDGTGRYRHYRNGSIFWSPTTGTHEVHGFIRNKWEHLGWHRSFLGYPISDETPTPDQFGRFNHFQFGSIYWHPDTGAWEIHGAIRSKWKKLGWERSSLGYPVTDELVMFDGVSHISQFQNGSIIWHPTTGVSELSDKPIARLKLIKLECLRTEDAGDDETYLNVNGEKVWRGTMTEGGIAWLRHIPTLPFFTTINIQLKEADAIDGNDDLGTYQADASEDDGKDHTGGFREDDAIYWLTYRVLH